MGLFFIYNQGESKSINLNDGCIFRKNKWRMAG